MFHAYREAVAKVNEALGGVMLIRGNVHEVPAGDAEIETVVVALGFDSIQAAHDYILSAECRKLEPMRLEAGIFTIRLVA